MYSLKSCSLTIVLSILLFSICSGQNALPEVTTVERVDLKKYTGTWYEISKIPNSFQDHCLKNTTATYVLNDDGTIIVINKCVDEDEEEDIAEGIAQIVDPISNSKLEVSFVSLFGINLFWGDYWILGLEENYRYVVVGTPNRKYGWILARDPILSEVDYGKCEEILSSNGYDPKIFVMSKQDY